MFLLHNNKGIKHITFVSAENQSNNNIIFLNVYSNLNRYAKNTGVQKKLIINKIIYSSYT